MKLVQLSTIMTLILPHSLFHDDYSQAMPILLQQVIHHAKV